MKNVDVLYQLKLGLKGKAAPLVNGEKLYSTNEWYIFDKALSKENCSRIIKLGDKGFKKGGLEKDTEITAKERIEGKKHEFELDKKKRTSDVAWVEDQWLYDLIWPYMVTANEQAGWKYDIKAAETIQISRYEKGSFYKFHKDGRGDNLAAYNRPDNHFLHGNVRKLSMSLLLNDDYEGGDFEFTRLDPEGKSVTQTPDLYKAGSIIVFPSFMMHRVEPVTKGTRYSLVAWYIGPPFK